MGARTPPSEGDVAGYGGSGSRFRGRIPGSVDAYDINKLSTAVAIDPVDILFLA
jgi:hypothetical protein